jgi:hypothetical protein
MARLMPQRPRLRAMLDEQFIDEKNKSGRPRTASGLAREPSASRRPTAPKLKFVDACDGAHESQHETFGDQPEAQLRSVRFPLSDAPITTPAD